MWRIRRSTAPSPTTTLVNDLSSAASAADLQSVVDWLPSSEQLGLGHESERSFKLFPHKTVTGSFSDCQDVGVGSSLPPRGPPGFDNCWFRLSSSNVLVQVGVSAVLPLPQAHQLPSMPVFCQEVHSPVTPATTVSAASSSQGASRSSTSVAAPVSSKLKPGKRKTIMCNNLQNCRFGKGCTFAHSESELRYFTLEELRQEQKRPVDYLTRPCLDYVTCGHCSFDAKCSHLHDPHVQAREGSPCARVFVRATSSCKPKLVAKSRVVFLNSITQENVLIQDSLWKMRATGLDAFDETCNFIGNTPEDISGIFNLPFDVANGTEKLSSVHKMAIALLMHKKSRFSEAEDTSFQAHLDFIFSARSGTFLDGTSCMILQARSFMIESGSGIVEEVPFQPGSPDVVTAYEVVFDAKGSTSCKHSLWFDATIVKSKDEAEKVEVNAVHSKPYVFMEPINKEKEGYELIHSIMEEMIGNKGGQMPSELREKFIRLNDFYGNLSWPETKPPSAESAVASKPMANHVNSEYNCEDGKVKSIWDRFKTNLRSVCDDEAPEGGSRLPAFRKIKADRRSVTFASSLPMLPKDEENIADFLSDYSQ